MSSIGRRMAEVRSATGLNQVGFAELINVARSSYKNYERDALDPPVSLVMAICERFGVDANWLLMGKTQPSKDELQKIEACIFFGCNFLEQEGKSLTPENINLAVATLLNFWSKDDPDFAAARPLFSTVMNAAAR
jgi:transcriptional regulator with XRE-family HTH domain